MAPGSKEQQEAIENHLHYRKKRLFGILGLMAGIGGIVLGAYNSWQISKMKGYAEEMATSLRQTQRSVKILQEGVETLKENVDAIQVMMHENIQYIWRNLEFLRCEATNVHKSFAQNLALQSYENYLRRGVAAAVKGTSEGKLTPELIDNGKLWNLLRKAGYTNNSIIPREPSLVYKYGKLYPVMMDIESLTFGYIMEVPILRKIDVMPVYRIYNVGFNKRATKSHKWDSVF